MDKCERIVVFGAGRSGQSFVNAVGKSKVLAVLDNDPAKWGLKVAGVRVCAPSLLSELTYDCLVIATNAWRSIIEQLRNENLAPSNKIVFPPKRLLSGQVLEDRNVRLRAMKLISLISVDEYEGVLASAHFGTLLGLVRGGDLISWDNDIDLLCHGQHAWKLFEKVSGFSESLESASGFLEKELSVTAPVWTSENQVTFEAEILGKQLPISIDVLRPRVSEVEIPAPHLGENRGFLFPVEKIFPLGLRREKQGPVGIPADPEWVLAKLYGDDFRKPNPQVTLAHGINPSQFG